MSLLDRTGMFRGRSRVGFISLSAIVALALLLSLPALSPGQTEPEGPPVIGCFHPKINRFSAEAHPSKCTLAGYRRNPVEFVEVPLERVNWHNWGVTNDSTFGFDPSNGERVRVIVYRLVTCRDGRQWYSAANFVNPRTGAFFYVNLPTCGRRSVEWLR